MSHHTVLHRLMRPCARCLAKTPVTPNHVTALRILTALAACAAFAGRAVWLGSGLFVASALLDRADGELARQTGRFSRWGHRLDLAGDCGADSLALLAIGMGASRSWLGWWGPALGLLGGLAAMVMFWCRHGGEAPDEAAVRRRFDPDDAMLGLPLLACCAGLPLVVLLAGVVTPCAAAWLLLGSGRKPSLFEKKDQAFVPFACTGTIHEPGRSGMAEREAGARANG